MNWLITAGVAYLLVGLAVAYLGYRITRADGPLDTYDRWTVASYIPCWPIVLFALLVDFLDWPGFNR